MEVANAGPNFGRAMSIDASSAHNSVNQNGFPIFPTSKRRVEIDWNSEEPPERVVLKFAKFTLQQTITTTGK